MKAIRIQSVPASSEDLLLVTSQLLRAAVEHADAVATLLEHEQVAATAALERSAWEVSEELQFLAKRDSAPEDATRSRIHAALDVLDHANAESGSGLRESVTAQVAAYETSHPALVDEMRRLRTRRKGLHWSGKTRTDVYAPDPASRMVYKLLSWEAHPIAVGIHEVELTQQNGAFAVAFPRIADGEELVNRAAWGVAHSLFFTWNTYAAIWKLRRVASPWPR